MAVRLQAEAGDRGPRPGGEQTSGVPQLPQSEAAKRFGGSPAPRRGSVSPRFGRTGRAGRPRAAVSPPSWGLASSGSQRPPPALRAALPHQEAIPERSCKALGSTSGAELSKASPWQPRVPAGGRRHASGRLPAERPLGRQLASVSFAG